MNKFYCGACQDVFTSKKEYLKHLDECLYVKYLLGPATIVGLGLDTMGHPLGGKIKLIRKYKQLIEEYVNCFINDDEKQVDLLSNICYEMYVSKEFNPLKQFKQLKEYSLTFHDCLDKFLSCLIHEPQIPRKYENNERA